MSLPPPIHQHHQQRRNWALDGLLLQERECLCVVFFLVVCGVGGVRALRGGRWVLPVANHGWHLCWATEFISHVTKEAITWTFKVIIIRSEIIKPKSCKFHCISNVVFQPMSCIFSLPSDCHLHVMQALLFFFFLKKKTSQIVHTLPADFMLVTKKQGGFYFSIRHLSSLHICSL